MRFGVVVYGGLDEQSGGFLYDRRLVERLRDCGHEVVEVPIPWRRYPRQLLDNIDRTLGRRLHGLDVDALLEDELCHPSLIRHNLRLGSVPIVSIVHHLRSAAARGFRARFYGMVERRYLGTVDAFIYNSRSTRADVEERIGATEGIVAPPPGDRFTPQFTPERIDQRASESGPLRIVFVGNVIPRKGLDTLVRGLSRIDPDAWHLTVVGDTSVDPDHVADVRALVDALGLDSAVALTGRLPDAELAATLARSHLLAVPSRYEGFGIVYLEGMAFGLPALATTAGGAAAVVDDGETGFLVPPDSPTAVAGAVESILDDRDRLADMGRAALERHDAHPSWRETAGRVETFLRDLDR